MIGWLIAYGIGTALATIFIGSAIGDEYDGTRWDRVFLWVVAWPVLAPIFALIVIGQMIRDRK